MEIIALHLLGKNMAANYFIADYAKPEHAQAVVNLLDAYANDPMGGGEPLAAEVKHSLVESLANFPGAFSVLCQMDNEFVGLANCFTGFSTFACKPLINIHDLAVVPSARGKGLSQGLLAFVDSEAKSRGCCKVTLEVLEGNTIAVSAYKKFGYEPYALDESAGNGLLMQKKL